MNSLYCMGFFFCRILGLYNVTQTQNHTTITPVECTNITLYFDNLNAFRHRNRETFETNAALLSCINLETNAALLSCINLETNAALLSCINLEANAALLSCINLEANAALFSCINHLCLLLFYCPLFTM